MTAPLLRIEGLSVRYGGGVLARRGSGLTAVRGLDLAIGPGQTYALVGESGSGKSSVVRVVAGLTPPLAGTVTFEGTDIGQSIRRRRPEMRRVIQIVFQNPDNSLNPRHSVATILARPLRIYHGMRGRALRDRCEELLDAVRLDPGYLGRRPSSLSGGERQRVAIARALAAMPRLVLCDEILSALDVSVQSSVLTLLKDLQAEQGLAYLFVSHDLAVVRWLAHRVGVLYRGEMMEEGSVERLFEPPFHPYTEALIAAIPRIGERAESVAHEALEPVAGVAERGCPFVDRCPYRIDGVCATQPPPWRMTREGLRVRCHVPLAELLAAQAHPQVPEPENVR